MLDDLQSAVQSQQASRITEESGLMAVPFVSLAWGNGSDIV